MDVVVPEIKYCVGDTFNIGDQSQADNTVLKHDAEDWKALGTHMYPQLVINGMTFKGRLTPDNVFEAICASFKHEPR